MSSRARIAAAGVVALFMLAPAPALGAADLSVSMRAEPNDLPLGTAALAEVVLTVENKGADPATSVTATVGGWEPELDFVSAAPSQGAFSSATGLWEIGTVFSGAPQTLTLYFSDVQSGVAMLQGQAATATAESGTANNSTSVDVGVIALVPSPEQLSFASQAIGGAGPPKALTLVNGAAIPVKVGSIQLAGDFVSSADGCTGMELDPDAACQVSLGFAPTAPGDRAGTLTVSSSTAKVFPLFVPLAGTGPVLAPIADTKAASLVLASVPKSIKAKKFKKGFQVGITPSEAAALEVGLLGTPKKGALASKFELKLFSSSLPLAAGTRKVKVKPAARLLGPLRKKISVQLHVVATDAAGNRSTVTRKITVRP